MKFEKAMDLWSGINRFRVGHVMSIAGAAISGSMWFLTGEAGLLSATIAWLGALIAWSMTRMFYDLSVKLMESNKALIDANDKLIAACDEYKKMFDAMKPDPEMEFGVTVTGTLTPESRHRIAFGLRMVADQMESGRFPPPEAGGGPFGTIH